jgi:hypothetical protein
MSYITSKICVSCLFQFIWTLYFWFLFRCFIILCPFKSVPCAPYSVLPTPVCAFSIHFYSLLKILPLFYYVQYFLYQSSISLAYRQRSTRVFCKASVWISARSQTILTEGFVAFYSSHVLILILGHDRLLSHPCNSSVILSSHAI